MTPHTQGKWIVRDNSDGEQVKYTVEHVGDGLRSVICRLNDMETCEEHGGSALGNAHLLAAAPELLAALKEVASTINLAQVGLLNVVNHAIEKAECAQVPA